MNYKKPQSTIVQGGVGIYPLTTADQVILADGSRLEKDGKISADSAANSVNSAKLGGKAPEYYIQPRNLLNNSDFRNPVNQRGQTSYSGTAYTIDRWWMQTDTGTASIGDNGLTLATNDSTSCKIMQYVEKLDINKVYTFVIKDTSENVYLIHSVPNGRNEEKTSFGSMIVNTTNLNNENKSAFSISLDLGTTITLVWAALYEGSYTAETLPPYVPKGYATELAECQRYFERLGSTFSEQIGNLVHVVSGAKSFVCSLQCSRKRLPHPSVSINGVNNYRLLLKDATNASVYSAASILSFDSITIQEPFISFRVNMVDAIAQNSWIQLQRDDGATAAYIDVSADL